MRRHLVNKEGEARSVLYRAVATIRKDTRNLRAAFHPDKLPKDASAERKKWQNEASQTVNEALDGILRKIAPTTK